MNDISKWPIMDHEAPKFTLPPGMVGEAMTCPCGGLSMLASTDPDRIAREREQFRADHADCVIDAEEVAGELEE